MSALRSTDSSTAPIPPSKSDTVMADPASDPTAETEVAPVRRLSLADLPPEIVRTIVEQVDLIASADHLAGHHPGHVHGNNGVAPPAAGGEADAAADPVADPGGFFADFMANLLLPRPGAAGAQPDNGTAGAAGGAGAANANAAAPAQGMTPSTGEGGSTSANPPASAQDDDDEMPPLEAVPEADAHPAGASIPLRPAPASNASNDRDADMSPPGSIAAATTPPRAHRAAAPPSGASSFLSAFSNPLAAFAGLTGSSCAPSTSPRSAEAASPQPSPAAATRTPPVFGPPPPPGMFDDDDMPPLEPLEGQPSTVPRTETTPAASTSAARTSAGGPALANPDDTSLPGSIDTSAGSSAAGLAVSPATADSGDAELPPLEPIEDDDAVPAASAPSVPAVSVTAGDEDDLPALEPIGGDAPAGPAPAVAAAVPASEATSGTARADRMEDHDDWYSDEDDDDEYDDEDYDEDDEDESDIEDGIYADGLPIDPVLPLAFINRPFLHAARKVVYKSVRITSPYAASLLRDTLSRTDPVGFVEGDDVVLPPVLDGEGRPLLKRNVLASYVRALSFLYEGDVTLGRGGGQVFIDLIRMSAENLETLTLRPMFFRSATKPLLEALGELKKLREIDFNTSADTIRPFLVTVPRVYMLMQNSWPDLERLYLTALRSSSEGPSREEDEMWKLSDEVAFQKTLTGYASREKADKAKGGGDGSLNGVEKVTEASKSLPAKRKGLKDLLLFEFNVQGSELALILQDSADTLQTLALQRPGYLFRRQSLASTLLTFGHNLTTLDLTLPADWDPVAKLAPGQSRPPFPSRPKDYKIGRPSMEFLAKIGRYTFVLDAIMPFLPHLTRLRFDGPYASAAIFAWFPPSLKTVSYSNCPTISPSTLNKILNKNYTRVREVKNPDGSKSSKTHQVKAARGMNCLTVVKDDLKWSQADLRALEDTLMARDCCLHLSSDHDHGGLFPLLGGFGLGGLFGLPGGGGGTAAGRAGAGPAERGPANP